MRRKKGLVVLLLACVAAVGLMSASGEKSSVAALREYYVAHLDTLHKKTLRLQQLVLADAGAVTIQEQFLSCRQSYKRIEALVEHFNPSAALKINGPPLPEAEPAEPKEPQAPSGFQVVEETVYGEYMAETRAEAVREIGSVLKPIETLQRHAGEVPFEEAAVADALRLNLYRTIAKGLSGFDAPASGAGIEEARYALESTAKISAIIHPDTALHRAIADALHHLDTVDRDFIRFDRARFISGPLRRVQEAFLDWQRSGRLISSEADGVIRPDASSLFAAGAYNVMAYAPAGTATPTAAEVALGKALFSEGRLSSTGGRACVSCHDPKKAFTDGQRLAQTLAGGRTLLRNTPTLLNAAFSPAQFWDSRIHFLEDQVHAVVSNADEMGGDFARIAARLGKDDTYRRAFRAAYGEGVTEGGVKRALAAYVRSLAAMSSPFDRYMRGDAAAMNAAQIRGFNLAMGKVKCATCHFLPFFNGAVPPLYEVAESEVLGVPASPDTLKPTLDGDVGKYALWGMEHQMHSFKTPTMRNAARTAPYMHNGVYQTLEEVVDFYDRGGGAGLGLDVPNQTLPPDRLTLSAEEKRDLVEFISALTDGE